MRKWPKLRARGFTATCQTFCDDCEREKEEEKMIAIVRK
jgi:hypothetical protein